MTTIAVRKTARAAARRSFLAAWIDGAGWCLLIAAGSALLIVVAGKLGWLSVSALSVLSALSWPWVIGGAAVAGAAGGAVIAWRRAVGMVEAARRADAALGLKDRLGSALAFEAASGRGPFVDIAMAEAEEIAARVRAAEAVKVRAAWPWWCWPVLMVGAGLVGFFAPAVDRAARVEKERQQVERREAAADLRQVTEAAATLAETSGRDEVVARELESVRQVEEELASGSAEPTEARSEGARAIERMADRYEARAEETSRVAQQLRDALSRAAANKEGVSEGAAREAVADRSAEPLGELAKALRRGDLAGAHEAAAEAAKQVESMSPDQRQALAEELKELARRLEAEEAAASASAERGKSGEVGSPGEPGDARVDAAGAQGGEEKTSGADAGAKQESGSKAADQQPQGSPSPGQPNAAAPTASSERPESKPEAGKAADEQKQREVKDLRDLFKQAARELESSKTERERQPQPEQQREGQDQPKSGEAKPSGSKQGQPKQGQSNQGQPQQGQGQQGEQGAKGERGGDQQQQREGGEPQSSGQGSKTSDGKPDGKTGDDKSAGSKTSGESKSGEKASDQRQSGSGSSKSEPRAGEKGSQPAPASAQSGERQEKSEQRGSEKASPSGAKSSEGVKPAEGAKSAGSGEKQVLPKPDGSKSEGARPEGAKSDGVKPDGSKAEGASKSESKGESPKPEQGSDAAKAEGKSEGKPQDKGGEKRERGDGQPGAGQQPTPQVPQVPKPSVPGQQPELGAAPTPEEQPGAGADPAAEKTPVPGQKPGSAMEQLAERLGKLSKMGEQAKQDEKTARQMRERAEELLNRATPEERRRLEELAKQLGDDPADGSRNPAPRDDQRRADGDRGEKTMGAGPGGTERADHRRGDAATAQPWASEETVDARGKPSVEELAGAPQREAARWSGDAPKRGEVMGAASSPERARQAARGFERAIEQQTVPGPFTDIVRRVQKRYAQRGAAAPVVVDPGRTVDAPDAKPAPR